MQRVESTLLADLNTYEVVNADTLVLTESAAKIFSEEENSRSGSLITNVSIIINHECS